MLKTCRAPSAGRRGKGARARSRGTSLCRTPRKGTSGQGLGGLLPAEHRGKGPPGQGLGGRLSAGRRGKGPTGKVSGDFSLPNAAERELLGKIPGCSFRAAAPRRRSFARKNSMSGARFLAAQVLPGNDASLQAAAAGLMRTGMPVFRPGMWEGAAQRAGGTRPFLRGNADSFHAAASAAAVCGTDCKIFQKTAKRSEKKLTPRGDCAKL